MTVNRRIRGRMAELGVTQAQLAGLLGVTQQSVGDRLRGDNQWRVKDLFVVAERLQTTIAYLVGETDRAERPDCTCPVEAEGTPHEVRILDRACPRHGDREPAWPGAQVRGDSTKASAVTA